jgi:hypothetical protein
MVGQVLKFLLKWLFILFAVFMLGTAAIAILTGTGKSSCPDSDSYPVCR